MDGSPSTITTKKSRKHKAVFSILQFSSGFTSSKKNTEKGKKKEGKKLPGTRPFSPSQFLMHEQFIHLQKFNEECPCIR